MPFPCSGVARPFFCGPLSLIDRATGPPNNNNDFLDQSLSSLPLNPSLSPQLPFPRFLAMVPDPSPEAFFPRIRREFFCIRAFALQIFGLSLPRPYPEARTFTEHHIPFTARDETGVCAFRTPPPFYGELWPSPAVFPSRPGRTSHSPETYPSERGDFACVLFCFCSIPYDLCSPVFYSQPILKS